jgi:hypothetical protein
LLVALAALVMLLKPRPVRPLDAQTLMTEDRPEFPTRTLVIVLAMIAIIAVPIALNTYGEAWNAFLKSLPLIGSSSALMRWFIVYVPFVAVIGGLAVDRITSDSRQRLMLSLVAAVGVAVALASTDRKFYEQQAYDPAPVLEAFEAARKNPGARPAISAVGAFVDPKGNILLPVNRQDLMIRGVSQLACYIPIFGYRLEFFPFRTLRPGSIYDTDGQGFNIKNPACFVFPKENNCAVGDHFPTSRRADLESFASYRSFPFEKSTGQKLADALSLVSLVLVMGVLGFALLMTLRRRIHDGA